MKNYKTSIKCNVRLDSRRPGNFTDDYEVKNRGLQKFYRMCQPLQQFVKDQLGSYDLSVGGFLKAYDTSKCTVNFADLGSNEIIISITFEGSDLLEDATLNKAYMLAKNEVYEFYGF